MNAPHAKVAFVVMEIKLPKELAAGAASMATDLEVLKTAKRSEAYAVLLDVARQVYPGCDWPAGTPKRRSKA